MKDVCWKLPAEALILLSFAVGSSVHAQQPNRDSFSGQPEEAVSSAVTAQANEAQMPASGAATVQPARTFSGRIVKENGELVLQDPVTKVSHKLSDASKAKKYLDQPVKITGKLDKNTNTIHIESIGPAA